VKPVYQTKSGDGSNGTPHGNCVAACYASLLEIPIEDVPELSDPAVAPNQYRAEQAWLATRGLSIVHIRADEGQVMPGVMSDAPFYMLSGISPRGFGHRVIARDGEIVHDPHPEGGGLKHVIAFVLLLPLDLARAAP
jgi:hypothetical protein